jgi:DNA-binding transcriptional LysR family regulator
VVAAFAEASAHLNVVASSELFAMICALVGNGAGVSIVDPASAAQFAGSGLAVRLFRPAIFYEIATFHSSERALSRLGQAFLDAFDAHLRGFVPPARKTTS